MLLFLSLSTVIIFIIVFSFSFHEIEHKSSFSQETCVSLPRVFPRSLRATINIYVSLNWPKPPNHLNLIPQLIPQSCLDYFFLNNPLVTLGYVLDTGHSLGFLHQEETYCFYISVYFGPSLSHLPATCSICWLQRAV